MRKMRNKEKRMGSNTRCVTKRHSWPLGQNRTSMNQLCRNTGVDSPLKKGWKGNLHAGSYLPMLKICPMGR